MTAVQRAAARAPLPSPSPRSADRPYRRGRRWLAGAGLVAVVSLVLLIQAIPAQAFAGLRAQPLGDAGSGAPRVQARQAATPATPGAPVAVAGDGQASLTITPPTSSGGPITGYYVALTDDRGFGHCDFTTLTTCVFHGLVNGVSYSFQSYAYNGSDLSTWSAPSNLVTPRSATSTPSPTASPTPTPVVAMLKLPTRIVSSTGSSGSAAVTCAISTGTLARCVVTATAVVNGQTRTIGYGVTTPALTDDVQQVRVSTVLTELGRFLAARPGGVRMAFTAEPTQRNQSGPAKVKASSTVVAKTFTLSRTITFGSGSRTLTRADSAYLTATAAKLTGARSITCIGHADSKESRPGRLALSRARTACAIVIKKLDATAHTAGKIAPHPKATANTPAARAHNRRVTLTITN